MKIQYTLDKLVMDVRVQMSDARTVLDKLGDSCGYGSVIKVINWQSGKISGFHENLNIELDNGESFFIGVSANWLPKSEYATTIRMEFNPAKVRNHIVFKAIHHDVVCYAKYIEYHRFDMAIDIPVDKRDVWLGYDQRLYTMFRRSERNKTEYLGQRSEHGRIKLYNKQMEAKLSYPLTRLELTIDYEKCSWEELRRIWPKVTYINTEQMSIEEMGMNGTDRVLLLSCMEHSEYLGMLERDKKKKIECIMQRYTHKLEPNEFEYLSILSDILTFSKGEYVTDKLNEYVKNIGYRNSEWKRIEENECPWHNEDIEQ